jgi:hypothetical protein
MSEISGLDTLSLDLTVDKFSGVIYQQLNLTRQKESYNIMEVDRRYFLGVKSGEKRKNFTGKNWSK